MFEWQGMNKPYLVNLQTITSKVSYPSDKGSSDMKSIETTSKGWVGMGIGCNNPNGACFLGFVF
jgi:hypothetical protein